MDERNYVAVREQFYRLSGHFEWKWKEKEYMSKLFNIGMTSSEARIAFFEACEGLTKEQQETLYKEYSAVAAEIRKRELDEVKRGIMH